MKQLLLLLLLPLTLLGQTNVTKHGVDYTGDGDPVSTSVSVFPGLATGSRYMNRQSGNTFLYKSYRWNADQNVYPRGAKGDKGDKGDTGAQGPIGQTGPAGQNGVCPSCPPSGGGMAFPFIVVVGTGSDDIAINQAVADNNISKKPIYLIGNITTTSITSIPKNSYRLTISGYGAKWNTPGIRRVAPTDNSDANLLIIARHIIEGVEFVSNGSGTCLDLGPSYMSAYRDLKFDSFSEAIHLRFALRTTIANCEAVNCVNGFIVDYGNWTGADNANSQSNQTTIEQSRCYMPSNGNIAIGVYAASGVVVRDVVIEGHICTVAIDFDGKNSNVVKDFTIDNVHCELVKGTSSVFLKVRLAGGTVTVNKVFGQYASNFLDAYSTSGLGFVQISNVPWWVGLNGKYFTTSNITLDFKYNEAFRGINSSMWNGTAPSLCTGNGCGYNKYTVTDIPR